MATLAATTTYEFFYQMSTTVTLYSFQAKVGQAVSPYTQTDYITSAGQDAPVPGAGLQSFAHTFVPAMGADTVAGIAFNIAIDAPGVICIDNVALGLPN